MSRGAHNLLKLELSESIKGTGKLSPVHRVSGEKRNINYTITNLSPVHSMSEGNAKVPLCALASYTHVGCAAQAQSSNKEQAKKRTREA